MVAAYRILVEGIPVEAALAEMQRYQGIWFKQDAQYLRGLTGERRARIDAMVQKHLRTLRPEARLTCALSGCRAGP
jgi:hypothetical protein